MADNMVESPLFDQMYGTRGLLLDDFAVEENGFVRPAWPASRTGMPDGLEAPPSFDHHTRICCFPFLIYGTVTVL
jgi:hypothetical protein